jgi:hypothetical protein
MSRVLKIIKQNKKELLIFFLALIFSSWLMFSTFSYKDGDILIASKAWSDFGSHIPLIRSFSLGDNFPPEYPLFAGQPIKYHFLFYAFAGIIEKTGIRIDYALNIPSILGFAVLLLMIYFFAKKVFSSTAVGIISVIFFLFNGSLSFLKFFEKYPLSFNSIYEIMNNTTFPSFGPYDHTSIVSAFWNLNIYTNQRHLGLSFALSLFILYLFLNLETHSNKKRAILKSVLIGATLGFSFILNMAVFLMTLVVLFAFLMFLKKERLYVFTSLVVTFLISFPLYKYFTLVPSTFDITLKIGYLVENLNIQSFLSYWFHNLGIHLILIPAALIISTKFQRKVFFSFLALFIIGNTIQFSPEIAANHNFFIIVGSMFSAYFLVYLWNKRKIFKPLVLVLVFFLTFSGIIDFFPIANDSKIALADRSDPDVQWIIKNTPPDSVFLNTDYFMDKASIAGRKIFLGWPYFAWSQGYNTDERDNLRKDLLNSKDYSQFCKVVGSNNLNFGEINESEIADLSFFENNFDTVYSNKNYYLFDLNKCRLIE